MTDERTNKQINAAIAERLLRWVWVEAVSCWVDRDGLVVATRSEFKPASDHNTALGLVVPAMADKGYKKFSCGSYGQGTVWAEFSTYGWSPKRWYAEDNDGSIPRAICLAGLVLDAEEKTE